MRITPTSFLPVVLLPVLVVSFSNFHVGSSRKHATSSAITSRLSMADSDTAKTTTTTTTTTTSTTSSISSSSSTATALLPPTPGSVVSIECCLYPAADFVPEPLFDGICNHPDDDKLTPLSFVLGEGNYLPGLHEVVSSMTELGETVEVNLDAGWGERNPQLEAWIALKDMPADFDAAQIKEGTQLLLANGLKAMVTQVVDGEKFKIDANPPLAGASYKATVKLVNVEEGPKETVYPGNGNDDDDASEASSRYQVATIALGCFWGVELEYMREPGVVGTKVCPCMSLFFE